MDTPQELPNVQSQVDFSLLLGVSETGTLQPSPFDTEQIPTLAPPSHMDVDTSAKFVIDSASSHENALKIAAGGSLWGATLLANAGVDHTFKKKANEVIFAMQRQITFHQQILPTNEIPKHFSQTALNILKEDPDKFHSIYGHYFVAGQTKGAQAIASVRIQENNSESITSIDNDLKSAWTSAAGNVSESFLFKLGNNDKYSKTDASIQIRGCDSDKSLMNLSLEEIEKFIATFPEHCKNYGCVLSYVIYPYRMVQDYIETVNHDYLKKTYVPAMSLNNSLIERIRLTYLRDMIQTLPLQRRISPQIKEIADHISSILELKELNQFGIADKLAADLDKALKVHTNEIREERAAKLFYYDDGTRKERNSKADVHISIKNKTEDTLKHVGTFIKGQAVSETQEIPPFSDYPIGKYGQTYWSLGSTVMTVYEILTTESNTGIHGSASKVYLKIFGENPLLPGSNLTFVSFDKKFSSLNDDELEAECVNAKAQAKQADTHSIVVDSKIRYVVSSNISLDDYVGDCQLVLEKFNLE